MQYFLSSAVWDEEKVAAEYRRRMLMETFDPQGFLVIDDTPTTSLINNMF